MKRFCLLVILLGAVSFAPTISRACEPGDVEAFFTGAAPPAFAERQDSFIALTDDYYVGAGTWKIKLLRGTVTSYINSPANGVPQYGAKGAIRAGDHVTIYAYGPFSSVVVGNFACAGP